MVYASSDTGVDSVLGMAIAGPTIDPIAITSEIDVVTDTTSREDRFDGGVMMEEGREGTEEDDDLIIRCYQHRIIFFIVSFH